MSNPLLTPIDYLNGVGPQRAEVIKSELKLFNYRDLLYHFPFRYVDKTQFYKINQINSFSAEIQIKGKIISLQQIGEKRKKRLVAKFQDETGIVELIWFKITSWLEQKLNSLIDKEIIIFGKPNLFNNHINFTHPEIEEVNKSKSNKSSCLGTISKHRKVSTMWSFSQQTIKTVRQLTTTEITSWMLKGHKPTIC